MDENQMKREIADLADAHKEEFEAVSAHIFENPELAFHETEAQKTLCGLLENIGEVSFAEMYANAAGVFYAGAVCFVVFAALFVYKLILRKKVVQSSVFAQMEADAAKVLAVSKEAMGIPEDARETDIFIRLYKITRRGKERNANLFGKFKGGHLAIRHNSIETHDDRH